jgi:hypothetical protein
VDTTTDTSGDGGSNGLDITSLMNNLVGTAGSAYIASQNSQAAIAASQAQAAASQNSLSNALAIFSPSSPYFDYAIIGAAILALALILRR